MATKAPEALTPQLTEEELRQAEALRQQIEDLPDIEFDIPENVRQESSPDDAIVHEIPEDLAEKIRQRYEDFGQKAIEALAKLN